MHWDICVYCVSHTHFWIWTMLCCGQLSNVWRKRVCMDENAYYWCWCSASGELNVTLPLEYLHKNIMPQVTENSLIQVSTCISIDQLEIIPSYPISVSHRWKCLSLISETAYVQMGYRFDRITRGVTHPKVTLTMRCIILTRCPNGMLSVDW